MSMWRRTVPTSPPTRIERIAFRAGYVVPALLALALGSPDAFARIGFNCGSQISITCLDSLDYLPDAEWWDGEAGGYVGGTVLQWNSVGLHHDGPKWERDLYREVRVGDHSYRFATEPGSYELTLKLIETVANGPENWLLNVSVDGQPLVTGFDPHAEVGKLRSLDLRRGVTAGDSILEVSLSGTAGNVGLAGIHLAPLDTLAPLRPAVVDLSVEPTYGGALVRWKQPAPEHLDGYVVTVEDGWGTDLSSVRTYEARAVVSADPTYIYRVEPVDSRGRIGAEATGAGVAEKPSGDSVLQLMELIVAEEDLRTMEQALRERVRVPADLRVDGLLSRGTVNFRGNATLEAPKKSYKVRIELGPDVDGSDVVSLAANFGDRSLIREIVGHELMVAAGHDAYRARPTRLTLNGDYAGVFTTVEEPDERYLERIGLDPVGRSYKVNGGLHPRADLDEYIEDFENTNEDDWRRGDIAGLLQELDTVPDNEFEEWFRAMFEVEQVLDWYATQVYLANSDFTLQNFLMTRDRIGGRWRILAWDADLLLKAPEAPANYCTSAYPDGKGRVHKLIDRALAVPAIMRQYLERLSALMVRTARGRQRAGRLRPGRSRRHGRRASRYREEAARRRGALHGGALRGARHHGRAGSGSAGVDSRAGAPRLGRSLDQRADLPAQHDGSGSAGAALPRPRLSRHGRFAGDRRSRRSRQVAAALAPAPPARLSHAQYFAGGGTAELDRNHGPERQRHGDRRLPVDPGRCGRAGLRAGAGRLRAAAPPSRRDAESGERLAGRGHGGRPCWRRGARAQRGLLRGYFGHFRVAR
ncbi:MAG: hypothetical protein CME06_12615 [Gemmatimonadetes bacterium]|nr:hypothetical protein [Gemmatimonadota bacterium]